MTSGRVVHVLGSYRYDLYIGRANPRRGLPASPWQNPFRIGRDGPRWEVLERYEARMRALLADTPGANPAPEPWGHRANLVAALADLRGKSLACWCAPKGGVLQPDDHPFCHGQILLRLAEEVAP